MRKIKAFKIEDEEFIAKELTVSQVKQILDEDASGKVEINFIDLLFPDRLPASAVAMSLGMTREELNGKDFPPSDLEKIMVEVESVNPIFAGLVKRLAAIGKAMATKSNALPAS